MKQRRTSLKDLAAQLGVSIATVSRALRNSHEVGEEMTKRLRIWPRNSIIDLTRLRRASARKRRA